MKFIMKTALFRNFWLIYFLWATCKILGALSVDTATTEQIPQAILESLKAANGSEIRQILNNTRRIILGREAANNRPYMVYLKLPASNAKFQEYRRWLCGGVIIHEEYILTSAACIEDVKHFYVVAGTFKFSFTDDRYNNPCIKNGAKKAVWKCIPRNYVFDGHENDNIRWMNNDIAIVKLEDEFDFTRRVRGCDYTPRPVCYNNQSMNLEEAGNVASIAGWGSTDKYNDWVNSRRSDGVTCLLESPVTIMGKPMCKKRWGSRYHNIIDNYMICTNDLTSELSEICMEKYVDCQDIIAESSEEVTLRRNWDPSKMQVHSANHNHNNNQSVGVRRSEKSRDGGFCENDHGGPLVYGEGVSSVVIGIISACLVKEKTNKCYGPFLYTSVYKNRVLINCAIYKNVGTDCNKLFRASVTHTEVEMSWSDHPDGPAKNEIKARRKEEERLAATLKAKENVTATTVATTNTTEDMHGDAPFKQAGIILRTRDDDEERNEELKSKIKHAHAHAVANKTTTKS